MTPRLTLKYVAKRFLYLVAVVWFAATINFLLPRIAAHDPVLEYLTELAAVGGERAERAGNMIDAYQEWAGLNRPLWQQYINYLRNMARFDFGRSFRGGRPVIDILRAGLPWTVGLLGASTIIAFVLGTVLGAWIGWKREATLLNLLVPFLMILSVIPPFIVALILIDVLAFRLQLFPLTGPYSTTLQIDWTDPVFLLDVVHHATLPALSMILVTAGTWAMWMRGMIITVLGADFLRFAESKGVKPWRIFLQYAVRNVMLPQATQFAISLGTLVAGYALVEAIFAYPGLGQILAEAIISFDYNLIQGVVFFLISGIALATFILDLLYPFLDPRITYR